MSGKIERDFVWLDGKCVPLVKVFLEPCNADDNAAWEERNLLADRIEQMIAAPVVERQPVAYRYVHDYEHGNGWQRNATGFVRAEHFEIERIGDWREVTPLYDQPAPVAVVLPEPAAYVCPEWLSSTEQHATHARRYPTEAHSFALYATQPMPDKYDDVLLPFLSLMRAELHANAGKGDRPGWLAMSSDTALLEIIYHFGKLQASVKRGDEDGIREYAADVANMCMMLVDVCAFLDKAKELNQ